MFLLLSSSAMALLGNKKDGVDDLPARRVRDKKTYANASGDDPVLANVEYKQFLLKSTQSSGSRRNAKQKPGGVRTYFANHTSLWICSGRTAERGEGPALANVKERLVPMYSIFR